MLYEVITPFALDRIEARFDAELQGQGAARAAIDMALHDWIGHRLGLPVWKWLGLDPEKTPLSCVTLGMADRITSYNVCYTKLLRYGRVLSRPRLGARVRELVAVTVLAAGGWSRQLHSHLLGAVLV